MMAVMHGLQMFNRFVLHSLSCCTPFRAALPFVLHSLSSCTPFRALQRCDPQQLNYNRDPQQLNSNRPIPSPIQQRCGREGPVECDHCGQKFHHLEQKKVGGGGVGQYIYRLNKNNGHNGHNGSVYTYIHIYISSC
jgi:hypothetical protein